MISATGQSLCFAIAAILLSTGTQSAAFGATAMVFIFQIFLGIGYLPIVSTSTTTILNYVQREFALTLSSVRCIAHVELPLALAVSRGGKLRPFWSTLFPTCFGSAVVPSQSY